MKNEAVVDERTGLIWLRYANAFDGFMDWNTAFNQIARMNRDRVQGQDERRVPEIRKLESLTGKYCHSPALPMDHSFTNIKKFRWSATTSQYDTGYAWVLYTKGGPVEIGHKPLPEFFCGRLRVLIPTLERAMKLIADNLRITRSDIRRALQRLDPKPVQALVKSCEARGAWAIDVNTGPLGKQAAPGMRFFMEAVQAVTDLPLLIDTANPDAMAAGVKAVENPVILNGFSLEPRKLEQILPLAREYDADIVGFLLYPDSRVPADAAQRFEVAMDLMEAAEAAGVAKERVIIDPVIPPLAWADGIVQARHVLEVIRTLPDLLGFPVKTIGGISNLGTNATDRAARLVIEQSYIAMLASAGLSFALLDILNPDLVKAARVSGILAEETLFSWGMVS